MPKKLLITLSLLLANFAINPAVNVITFTTPKIGPFVGDEEVDTSVHYKFKLTESYYARFRCFIEAKEDYWSMVYTSSRFLAYDGLEKDSSFPFPTTYLKAEEPLNISYRIYDDDTNNIKYSLTYQLQLVTPRKYNVKQLENKCYTGVPYSVKIISNNIIYYRDEYDFLNLGEDILADTYLSLNLEQLKFKYNGEKMLTNGDITLSIYDYRGLFIYLPRNLGYVTIDLALEFDYSTLHYNLTLADGYYVNPKTLEMSNTNRTGFVETDTFYLPINMAEYMDGINLSFKIENCGYELNTFTFSCKYYYGKKLIGDCTSSDYCIVGELYD